MKSLLFFAFIDKGVLGWGKKENLGKCFVTKGTTVLYLFLL